MFAGDSDQEKLLATLNGNVTTYTDSGATEATGALASDYDDNAPYQYIYSFTRSVGGIKQESGPSDLSYAVTSTTGRLIEFDYKTDGTLEGKTAITGYSLTISPSANQIMSAVKSAQYNQVKFTTAQPHGLRTGGYVNFTGL